VKRDQIAEKESFPLGDTQVSLAPFLIAASARPKGARQLITRSKKILTVF
jgi:hypothetical protein